MHFDHDYYFQHFYFSDVLRRTRCITPGAAIGVITAVNLSFIVLYLLKFYLWLNFNWKKVFLTKKQWVWLNPRVQNPMINRSRKIFLPWMILVVILLVRNYFHFNKKEIFSSLWLLEGLRYNQCNQVNIIFSCLFWNVSW